LAKRYYVGPDNGLFGLVADREGIDKIWELDKIKYHRDGLPSSTFRGRDIFAPVAGHLASGVKPEDLGSPIKRLEPLTIAAAKVVGSTVTGEVLYLDRYGNVVTNIPATISSTLKSGALLRISFGNQNFSAPFVKTYSAVPSGRPLLLSNSQGLLEFALNQGSASKQFKVQVGMSVMIRP
jgi:S-adenosylmethionine hydrolase